MKVSVDKETCTGCGLCSDSCPEVFELLENESIAKAKVEVVPTELETNVKEAAENCPLEAIRIV